MPCCGSRRPTLRARGATTRPRGGRDAGLPVPETPRRVLVVRDLHASIEGLRAVVSWAVAMECDGLLQVGDLGFWPHDPSGAAFLSELDAQLDAAGLTLWFVDSNH